jgi:hypothetical protein
LYRVAAFDGPQKPPPHTMAAEDCVPWDGNAKRTAARDNLRVTVYNGVCVVVFMEIRG